MTFSTDGKINILVVGDKLCWPHEGNMPSNIEGVTFVADHEVATYITGINAPDTVVSPLTAPTFDALDIAQTLGQAGFCGVYYVVTFPLPVPDVVRREIRQVAPHLRFELISPEGFANLGQSVRSQRPH